eukprot:3315362-Rhodomonas_salina.5
MLRQYWTACGTLRQCQYRTSHSKIRRRQYRTARSTYRWQCLRQFWTARSTYRKLGCKRQPARTLIRSYQDHHALFQYRTARSTRVGS